MGGARALDDEPQQTLSARAALDKIEPFVTTLGGKTGKVGTEEFRSFVLHWDAPAQKGMATGFTLRVQKAGPPRVNQV